MPLAISFIVHQFHNRPIEGLLYQFMSIMNWQGILIFIVHQILEDLTKKAYLGQANEALVSKAQCDQQARVWVVCGPGEGHSSSGCEALWMRLSASEKQGEDDSGRREIKDLRWCQWFQNWARTVDTSLSHQITSSKRVGFFKSKNRKFRQKPSNPSQLNNIAVPERKQWKWVLQGFQPQQKPWVSTLQLAFWLSSPPISSSSARSSHMKSLYSSKIPLQTGPNGREVQSTRLYMRGWPIVDF